MKAFLAGLIVFVLSGSVLGLIALYCLRFFFHILL